MNKVQKRFIKQDYLLEESTRRSFFDEKYVFMKPYCKLYLPREPSTKKIVKISIMIKANYR